MFIGNQHDWEMGACQHCCELRADGPAAAGNMGLAKLHARAQVDGDQLALGQPGGHGLGADFRQRRHGGGSHCGQSELAGQPVVEHAGIVAHLVQPTGHRAGADAVRIKQHQPGVTHADILVVGLHQLAAGHMLGAGQATKSEFLRAAYIAQEQRALRILRPGLHRLRADRRDIETRRQGLSRSAHFDLRCLCGWRPGLGKLWIAAFATMLEPQISQVPALSAVFECRDGVGHAEIDQGLRADDAARTASTIDHDMGFFAWHQVADPQAEFAIRAAGGGRNIHFLKLRKRPTIQHHDILFVSQQSRQFGRADAGRVVRLLGQFAKGLVRDIDPGKQRKTGGLPAVGAAAQHMDIGVPQIGQPACGGQRHAQPVIVVHHQPHAQARCQPPHLQLKSAVGQGHAEEQM